MTKNIWITGASSGIGAALALEMAERGWQVFITARSNEKLDALAARHALIHVFAGDVMDAARMVEIVSEIEQHFGPIDTAILNAAIYLHTNAVPFERDIYIKQIETNQIGPLNALAALVPRMTQRRSGALWLVASVAGFGGLPTAAAYGSTKAALINLAECLKFDLDKFNVHMGVINPGFVDTPLIASSDYKKPFMISAEDAAKRIANGIARRPFEITFPKRFTWFVKFIGLLPYPLYFGLVKASAKWAGRA